MESTRRLVRGWAVVALVATAAWGAWTVAQRGPFPPGAPRPLAAFTERHVAVVITFESDTAGHPTIVATFTPQRAGDHLYSKDLPKGGLDGVGRPTLLEVASPVALVQSGSLTSDQLPTTVYIAALATAFPVYPAGPVTLRMPVAHIPGGPDAATLSVTYMACNERSCFPPVVDRRVPVSLPAAFMRRSMHPWPPRQMETRPHRS